MARVSVNICCYNGEKYLAEAIKSVLDQTYTDFEVVIVNDGSNDTTEKVVLAFKDERIKYFYQANVGLSAARNRALSLSNGEFVAILDQDDLWAPEKLELQVGLMDSKPDVGVVYSAGYTVGGDGTILRAERTSRYCRGEITGSLLKGNYISCPTVMFRASALKKVGGFRTDLKIAEEYDMYLRLARVCKFDFVDKPLARYRVHSSNTSKDRAKDYMEAIVCLVDFSAVEKDEALRVMALKYADIYRLRLAAVLIWSKRGVEVPALLENIRPGTFAEAAGFVLRLFSFLPFWLSRILLLPVKAAGIIQ